ncbi:hypothetical protein ACHAQA_009449 [Verticillium albo-atrum]
MTNNATRRFAEVQSAYEVLSDPQERAWYDSHREAILRGADTDEYDQHAPEFNNIRLTSTEDILSLIRRFNSTVPFTDDPVGFFGILNETFAHLADEEDVAGDPSTAERVEFPPFGESSDEYDTVVKTFYASWAGFSTTKTFAWKDKYRLSDAPDRRVRRAMEKENKKMRDDAIKEFNDAVRFLVTFARKRDPRYLPNSQTDAERQAALRNAAAAQAARSRAANLEKLNEEHSVPEWAQSRQDEADAADFSQSEGESEVVQIECIVCDKIFKSEKSFEAHERSKKHLKAVQQLRRQMRAEDFDLSPDVPPGKSGEVATNSEEESVDLATHSGDEEASVPVMIAKPSDTSLKSPAGEVEKSTTPSTASDYENDDNDEYAPRAAVEERVSGTDNVSEQSATDRQIASSTQKTALGEKEDESPSDLPAKKTGKARAKREKKAAREAAAQVEGVCYLCLGSRVRLTFP